MTQCERILEHLQTHGSITDAEARSLYGISRAGARIWDLRHKHGYHIRMTWENGKNRYGEPTHWARYTLLKGTDNDTVRDQQTA